MWKTKSETETRMYGEVGTLQRKGAAKYAWVSNHEDFEGWVILLLLVYQVRIVRLLLLGEKASHFGWKNRMNNQLMPKRSNVRIRQSAEGQ